MCACVCVSVRAYIYVCVCVCARVCVYAHVCVHLCLCVCVYAYVKASSILFLTMQHLSSPGRQERYHQATTGAIREQVSTLALIFVSCTILSNSS